jgi:FKBP-type peptidyl-prolyl cis-trans isomerase
MKKLFVCILSLATTFFAMGQSGAKPKVPATKPTAAKPAAASTLKNFADSTSYAIGVSVASFYKQQGVTNINTTVLAQAAKDVLAGKALQMNEMQCNTVMNKVMSKLQEAEMIKQEGKSKPNIDSGAAFLARNKQRPEVKTTASGLQYEVVKEGTGAHPTATDSVTCNYKGTLINGTEFDNSYTRGEPITFPLNHVIPGWTEGVQLMSVGSIYKLYIPYNLAYGAADNGPIPGGSTLVFQVELLNVKKGPGQ